MSNTELFERLLTNHKEKKIQSCCKKLIKKCSFDSGADAENLCHLAFWLFVYEYEDEALLICELTHNVPFPGKGMWNVWDFIMFIWGLEVHILKKRGHEDLANRIIEKMDALWLTSLGGAQRTYEQEMARRERFDLAFCSHSEEIEHSYSPSLANGYRFTALFKLVGYTATDLYPNLKSEKRQVEEIVTSYMEELRK